VIKDTNKPHYFVRLNPLKDNILNWDKFSAQKYLEILDFSSLNFHVFIP